MDEPMDCADDQSEVRAACSSSISAADVMLTPHAAIAASAGR